jgi:hypothetical protein
MRFAHLAVVAGVLGAQFACTDGTDIAPLDTFDTGDNPTPEPGPPLIQGINPAGCASAGANRFEFAIENSGWADDAILYIFDTSYEFAYDEEHPMNFVEADQDAGGFYDIWDVSLDVVAIANQVPGQSTAFNCADATDAGAPGPGPGAYTYAIEVYDGSTVADCAVFGSDPQEIIDGSWPDDGFTSVNGTVIGNQFSNCINFNQ